MSINLNFFRVTVTFLLLTVSSVAALAQRIHKNDIITDEKELRKLAKAVESNPDSSGIHLAYIKAMGLDNPKLEAQYDTWIDKYPKSVTIPYALANVYVSHEYPKAKKYLLRSVEIDSNFAAGWAGLYQDAQRWGEFEAAGEYMGKAALADPSEPLYAFYYASSFVDKDWERYVQMSLDLANRFSEHDRGAQSLYWLAKRSKTEDEMMKYYELLGQQFDPVKFAWSANGMMDYFNLLLNKDPQKALALSKEQAAKSGLDSESAIGSRWVSLASLAEHVLKARKLMADNKGEEAAVVLSGIVVPRGFDFNKELVLMKAEAADIAGNTNAAYDSIMTAFTKRPNLKFKEGLLAYGNKMEKDSAAVNADILKKIYAGAKEATPFTLKNYYTNKDVSLANYKGKVLLLTYWFPGCGPCRAEFPHFENVVKKFKDQDLEYIGINIVPQQNDYVLPFMKSSGYSFTPLEDFRERVKGNLDNRGAAPVNFLIDKEGRVVFSNFRTDSDNEYELEMMIDILLKEVHSL